MIKIRTKYYPFGKFVAITHWPFIFYKKYSIRIINHEKIHLKQQIELFIVGFYIVYFVEWIFKGYKNISFEQEAYKNESNLGYLKHRKIFNQWR